jgi:hypothetical protein
MVRNNMDIIINIVQYSTPTQAETSTFAKKLLKKRMGLRFIWIYSKKEGLHNGKFIDIP